MFLYNNMIWTYVDCEHYCIYENSAWTTFGNVLNKTFFFYFLLISYLNFISCIKVIQLLPTQQIRSSINASNLYIGGDKMESVRILAILSFFFVCGFQQSL